MTNYLMRVEAVNFDSSVGDVFDLSTVRGAGLLLLDAASALSVDSRLESIYSGASAAVFRFAAQTELEAAQISADAERLLHANARAGATILVVYAPLPDESAFPVIMRRLQNKIRWSQLHSPSVVYPALTQQAAQIDELDDLRPALARPDMRKPSEEVGGKGSPMSLSDTTYLRRKHGIEQKQRFYESRAGWDGAPWRANFPSHAGEYVNDFNQLAEHADKRRVNGKIALIYLDGNKFGDIAASCRTPDEIRRWSETVQANQNSFLHWLLSVRVDHSPTFPFTSWHWSGDTWTNSGNIRRKERAFRIETLLWGGDEIIWVVPAWCGWWLLANFLDLYGRIPWKVPGAAREFTTDGTYRLTHGAAMVFAHSNAPIHRLIRTSKHLAENPKARGTVGLKPSHYTDYFTYQVLESFDHLGSHPDEGRLLQMPRILRASGIDSLTLPGAGMNHVFLAMEDMREKFPRSKLHWLLDLYCNHPEMDPDAKAAREIEIAGLTDTFVELLKYFSVTTPDQSAKTAATWMHIAQLWDYTPTPDFAAPPLSLEDAN